MPKPPKLAKFLLKILSSQEKDGAYLGDIEEFFHNRAESHGIWRSKRWYWMEMARSIPRFVKESILWRITMLGNYFKTAFRNIKRHNGYSFINIFGLAVGMAVFTLIFLYIQYELSFDRYHENSDRIYRILREHVDEDINITNSNSVFIPNTLGPTMVEEFPEVTSTARFFRWHRGENYFSLGNKGIYEKMYYVDPEFFEMFSIPFIHGNPKTALKNPLSLILSERLAEKYFRNENPVGKQMMLRRGSRQYIFMITGVFKNMPDNSHLAMDLIIPFSNLLRTNSRASCPTYILTRKGVDPKHLEQKLKELINRQFSSTNDEIFITRYFLQPLTAIHLHSHISDNTIYSNYNDIRNIYIYASIAILVLIIVCLNYMNLTAARSFQRYKEIGVRKVVGANRMQLFRQYLSETFLITIISLTISIIFVVVFLPGFNSIIRGNLSLAQMQEPTFFLVVVFIVVFVGIVGGSYPAFYMSSFRSVNIIKGVSKKSAMGSWVRKIPVIAQFSIAIMIIISTIVIIFQLNFINTMDTGYNREQIIVLSHLNNHREIRRNKEAIKAELQRNPNISSVSCSNELPNSIIPRTRVDLLGKNTGQLVPFNAYCVDYDFVDLFEIGIVEGRHFSREFHANAPNEVLINETAARIFKEDSPIGQEFQFWGSQTGKIVGIVKDFHSLSLHHQVPPTFIIFDPTYNNHISIKINTMNISGTIDYIRKTMKKFAPNYQLDFHFFDEIFQMDYQDERKMETIFRFFMLLSIGLACMGLVGIATYSTQLRIKEIGIRKVLGASVPDITGLISKDFIKCVLLANIIAWPVAYYSMNKWLQNFAYRINLSIWVFILSGLSALAVAFLTTSYQTIKAALANPVDSLRYE